MCFSDTPYSWRLHFSTLQKSTALKSTSEFTCVLRISYADPSWPLSCAFPCRVILCHKAWKYTQHVFTCLVIYGCSPLSLVQGCSYSMCSTFWSFPELVCSSQIQSQHDVSIIAWPGGSKGWRETILINGLVKGRDILQEPMSFYHWIGFLYFFGNFP